MSTDYEPDFTPLDDEEGELAEIDFSTVVPYPDEAREAMLAPFRADPKRNVTLRLSESLIEALRKRADAEGLPYQTLAMLVLRKYVSSAYLDREAVREVAKTFYAAGKET
ncbi:MAG: BrnA antitoxin family protein [Spirochaetales bacterium]|nr:BrnA antitoxin family protein [Spirochaetales bacterium]